MKGHVALVAGGTGALGSELSLELARQGCTVYVTTRTEHPPLDQPEPLWKSMRVIKADVSVEPQVIALFDRIVEESARIDIVINAVGGYLPAKMLTDVSVHEWDLMMNTNLKTTFLLTREALRRMNGRPFGRIINISAMAAFHPTPGRIPYSLSKHAVSMLTELAAEEIAGFAITVNAIAPEIINTPANREGVTENESRQWISPTDIAKVIVYLCSPAAGVINGTTIRLPGGS